MDGATTEGKAMTLTCVAAIESVWSEIEAKWLQVKRECGDPDYVHMTELMALQGIYKTWSEEQRDELIWRLIEALNSFMDRPGLQSFTCRVNLEAYERWSLVRDHPNPARLCARIVFPQMLDSFCGPAQGVLVDLMDIFFDQNEPFMRHIRADWQSKKIRDQYPVWNLVRRIDEADMKTTLGIQIADMICWGVHRQGTYIHPEPWLVDEHGYTIAVRSANAIRGKFTEVGEAALAKSTFKEEGQALIELWNKKRILVPNPSEEYKRFDRMMRRLMYKTDDQQKQSDS